MIFQTLVFAELTTVEGLMVAAVVSMAGAICWMMKLVISMRADQQSREDTIHAECKRERLDNRDKHDQKLSAIDERAQNDRKEFTAVLLDFSKAARGSSNETNPTDRG